MIQRRLRLIDKAELDHRQQDDQQQRQRNRRFDDGSSTLPTAAACSSHIHVTLGFLASRE
nr:hypothetical protein [Peristeroidobacter soli]